MLYCICIKQNSFLVMSILLLFILNFSYKYAESLPKYSDEVNQTLFGDLASVQELLMTAKYTLNSNGTSNPHDFNFPGADMDLNEHVNFMEPEEYETDEESQDHAEQTYNTLSKEIKVMRRLQSFDHDDLDDTDIGIYGIERKKRMIIRSCFLQFIIHTRHEVGKALRQRESLREDKRYRLGYLFNRLRRIKTEQLKLLYYLHDQIRHRSVPWGHWFQYYHTFFVEDPFLHHLMIYEKLTAFDVDIKDTANYIKEIFKKKEAYDYVESDDKSLTLPTVRPQITAADGVTIPDQAKQHDKSLPVKPSMPGGLTGTGPAIGGMDPMMAASMAGMNPSMGGMDPSMMDGKKRLRI